MNDFSLNIENLSKSFTIHAQGGLRLPVLESFDLDVASGECIALVGPSGAGKSTLLRCIYANYLADSGRIALNNHGEVVDIRTAAPREVLKLRQHVIGYVSQFLRVIPRVPTVQVVAEPLRDRNIPADEATARAEKLLARLNVPEKLWQIPPATFSGGEQQRVNIARGFIYDFPLLLLDEPTASLDRANGSVVIELINEARERGAAIIGIFHDEDVRAEVATRLVEVQPLQAAA